MFAAAMTWVVARLPEPGSHVPRQRLIELASPLEDRTSRRRLRASAPACAAADAAASSSAAMAARTCAPPRARAQSRD